MQGTFGHRSHPLKIHRTHVLFQAWSVIRNEIGGGAYDWSSGAEVASHIGDGHWSVELRLPISTSSDDPLHTVVGRKPTESLPWYFNVGRKRGGTEDGETTVYSHGGEDFHHLSRFGKLRVR